MDTNHLIEGDCLKCWIEAQRNIVLLNRKCYFPRIFGLLTAIWFSWLWLFVLDCHANAWIRVEWVDDGDTVVLADGRRIRYLGINAPEIQHGDKPGEPFGCMAQQFNKRLVLHQQIRLEQDAEHHDAYGRHLAYLFLPDGVFVNAEILRQGYAYCLSSALNTRYEAHLLIAQREAMQQGRGIWKKMDKNPNRLMGNIHSKRFHRMECQFATSMRKEHRIFFGGKWDAFWEGYAPCKRCFP